MDEPFQGLDKERKEQVMDYVEKRIKGRTFLFVTHIREEAAYLGAEVLELEG